MQPIFDRLVVAGILHYTPESAADKLNEVYLDPSSWWKSEQVQSARKHFCDAVAYTDVDWMKEWVGELRKIGL